MYCPYAVNQHTTSETVFEYNEDGLQTYQQTIDHNIARFAECKQAECGAWKNGSCCYGKSG